MCGIVGYIGHEEALAFLIPALKRLEYRGYDSAGVATVNGTGLEVCKTEGRIAALEALLAPGHPAGSAGIAHTRWATHGRPSTTNAHPHLDCSGDLAVVHNGIIENHRELRDALLAAGHRFRSETDTEVIAHLIEEHRDCDLLEAVRRAAGVLKGSYAVACVAGDRPDLILAVRSGSAPLVMGSGNGEAFLASDIPALLGKTREVIVLGDGELAALTREGVRIQRLDGTPVHRSATAIPWDADAAARRGYSHFMLKEICEQPEVLRRTMGHRVDADTGHVDLSDLGIADRELARIVRVIFVACGTSWHAALVGKYLVEDLARLPVEAEIASEVRDRHPIADERTLVVPVSQSGETADTLAALRALRQQGARVVAICNAQGSSVAREADGVFHTAAGLEVGVAATKTFTAQLAAVTLLALKLAWARGTMQSAALRQTARSLAEVPTLLEDLLAGSDDICRMAGQLVDSQHVLYLGRGLHYPLALEGALKLKEISYIHAEGYPAGEMKHGPIALIDWRVPVVAIAPCGPPSARMAGNIQEVKARDGFVLAIVSRGDASTGALADLVIPIPPAAYRVQPLLVAIPLQLLAYHLGVLRGTDVDQPRNLAKSVTVE